MNNENFDKINNILKENACVTSFIKDYVLRFRFADIALNGSTNPNYIIPWVLDTTESMVNRYTDQSDDIIERYNDTVKDICSSSNVKAKCELGNMMSLKKDLDRAKTIYFGEIINQYNKTSGYGTHSGKITEYMLYDMYTEYINGDDFVYDENNPYVVELYYHITSFLQIREKLECNGGNIQGMISKFQTMCNDTLREFWNDPSYDYYGKMSEIFQYDFYKKGDDFIKCNLGDTDLETLYSKVLNYLRNLTDYKEPESTEEKYKGADINAMLNGTIGNVGNQDTSMIDLDKKLKKIAITFVQIRRITNSVDTDYIDQYIQSEDTDAISSIIGTNSVLSLQDYAAAYSAAISAPPSPESEAAIAASIAGMLPFTDPIVALTRNESRILRDLSDRAIAWYNENDQKIQNGTIFTDILEVSWPSPMKIYKDSIKHDFYFLEDPKTIQESMDDPMMNGESDSTSDDGYNYTEDSMKTKSDIMTMGYWIKYCTMATLVNCMLPMYWPTGLLIAGAPIPLPVIYIPIIVLPGRVTLVIGLGICGVCPLPMILYVNYGNIDGSLIPPINTIVDFMKKIPSMTMKIGEIPVKETIKGLIKKQDDKINKLEREKRDLEMMIQNINTGVDVDMSVLRSLEKMRKQKEKSEQ